MLNVHFHALVLDGVYEAGGRGAFQPAPPPDRLELERVVRRVARRLGKLLDRRDLEESLLADDQPLLAGLAEASIRGRIATGERAGRGVQRLGDRINPEDMEDDAVQAACIAGGGFSLHAGVVVPPGDRRRLEHLCRYVARPPVATERPLEPSRRPTALPAQASLARRDDAHDLRAGRADREARVARAAAEVPSGSLPRRARTCRQLARRRGASAAGGASRSAVRTGPAGNSGRCSVESTTRRQPRLPHGRREPLRRRTAGRAGSSPALRPARQPAPPSLVGADAPRVRS